MQNYRELYNDRDAIMWLFHDRCVMCGQQAVEINEIVPRSRTKQATKMWKNQVSLCHSCHSVFHHNGVTLQKQREMLGKRKEFLTSIGRERFI